MIGSLANLANQSIFLSCMHATGQKKKRPYRTSHINKLKMKAERLPINDISVLQIPKDSQEDNTWLRCVTPK